MDNNLPTENQGKHAPHMSAQYNYAEHGLLMPNNRTGYNDPGLPESEHPTGPIPAEFNPDNYYYGYQPPGDILMQDGTNHDPTGDDDTGHSQIGGGRRLGRIITLTKKAPIESQIAAQKRRENIERDRDTTPVPQPQPTATDISTTAPQSSPNTVLFEEMTADLNDDTIASLASDMSFLTPSPERDTQATAIAAADSRKGSAWDQFLAAGQFEKLVLPPGPNDLAKDNNSPLTLPPSSPPALEQSVESLTAALDNDMLSATLPATISSDSVQAPITAAAHGSSGTRQMVAHANIKPAISRGSDTKSVTADPSRSSSSKDDKTLKTYLAKIDKIFADAAVALSRPVSDLISEWAPKSVSVKSSNPWNTYQTYFAINQTEERERVGDPEANCAKCYPAFLKDYGDSAEAVMLTSIAYARLDGSEESLRKRGRAFDRYVGKVGNVMNEGVVRRFQSITIAVGDCVHEDQSLGTIVATPGLQHFFEERLKLDMHTITGLAKTHAFAQVAQTIADGYEADEVIASNIPQRQFDPTVIPDVSNETDPLQAIKILFEHLFATAGKRLTPGANGKVTLPWITLGKALYSRGLIMTGWPLHVPFPHEHVDDGKASQGVKDLTVKYARMMVTAMQDGAIQVTRADQRLINKNQIPVIETAAPAYDDLTYQAGRRLFLNDTTDNRGLLRHNRSATVVKRKNAEKQRALSPISIPSDTQSPPSLASKRPHKGPAADVIDIDVDDAPTKRRKVIPPSSAKGRAISISSDSDSSEEEDGKAREAPETKASPPPPKTRPTRAAAKGKGKAAQAGSVGTRSKAKKTGPINISPVTTPPTALQNQDRPRPRPIQVKKSQEPAADSSLLAATSTPAPNPEAAIVSEPPQVPPGLKLPRAQRITFDRNASQSDAQSQGKPGQDLVDSILSGTTRVGCTLAPVVPVSPVFSDLRTLHSSESATVTPVATQEVPLIARSSNVRPSSRLAPSPQLAGGSIRPHNPRSHADYRPAPTITEAGSAEYAPPETHYPAYHGQQILDNSNAGQEVYRDFEPANAYSTHTPFHPKNSSQQASTAFAVRDRPQAARRRQVPALDILPQEDTPQAMDSVNPHPEVHPGFTAPPLPRRQPSQHPIPVHHSSSPPPSFYTPPHAGSGAYHEPIQPTHDEYPPRHHPGAYTPHVPRLPHPPPSQYAPPAQSTYLAQGNLSNYDPDSVTTTPRARPTSQAGPFRRARQVALPSETRPIPAGPPQLRQDTTRQGSKLARGSAQPYGSAPQPSPAYGNAPRSVPPSNAIAGPSRMPVAAQPETYWDEQEAMEILDDPEADLED